MLPAPPRVTRGHSCFSCQQRKVKCDGQRPCSTCLRNGGECTAGTRVQTSNRGPVQSTKVNYDRLVEHLKHCEETLRAHGIPIDEGHSPTEVAPRTVPNAPSSPEGQMIVKSGDSRYVDK